jgi:transcriptional regulator with XRE-family HTH domain
MRLVVAFDTRYTLRRDLEDDVIARIRALLRALGWSESELGRRLGFTQPSLSRRMVGASRWELSELEHVARVLGVTAEELVGATK